MNRLLWLGLALFVYVVGAGCGQTFRPIIIPNPPTFPNPAAAHTVLTVGYNFECLTQPCNTQTVPENGSAMVIDVSGDSIVSEVNLGLVPVHAVQQSASQVLVVNQYQLGSSSNCASNQAPPVNVCPSLSKISFSGTTISGTPATISLPPNSAPNFVATTEANQAYVSLPQYAPPSVAVVSTLIDAVLNFVPVGNNAVAMAETPDATKLYVANQGDSTISGFNTGSQSLSPRVGSPVTTSSPPIWLSARSDSQVVYALEANGNLAALNTLSSAGPDTLTEYPGISVPGATVMTYDPNLLRLYIPGEQSLAMVDVSGSTPTLITDALIAIPTVPTSSRTSGDPCAVTPISTQKLMVAAVAALPNGAKAYVGAYYADGAGNVCPQVTVINTVSNTISGSAAVPGFPDATQTSDPTYYVPACVNNRFRFMMAAAGDSTRAYLSACDGGNVNFIDTSTDTYLLNQQAPTGARPPIGSSGVNPPQSPVFMIAGP